MPRPTLTPRLVLEAAAELSDECGSEQLTLSAVARRLGVQPASLYNHVRDRAELMTGLHTLALEVLGDRIAVAVAGRAGRDALVGLAEAQRSFAREHPGRWAALQQPAAPAVVVSAAARRVATLTIAVLRDYALPESELVHVTRFVGATVHGFLALERSGQFAHRSPGPEESWRRALTALDALLRAWPTPVPEETSR